MENGLLPILIIVGIGYWTGSVAKKKGYDFWAALFLGMFLPIVVLIVYALLPVRRNKETGEVLAQKKTNPWLIAIVMSLFLIAFSNALGGSPESQSNGGSTMTIILIIAVVIVIMMISGAWRLGGGISDWIDNQAAEKRKRDEEK